MSLDQATFAWVKLAVSAAAFCQKQFYYHGRINQSSDATIMEDMGKAYLSECTFGTRRYTKEFKRLGYTVGRQKLEQ